MSDPRNSLSITRHVVTHVGTRGMRCLTFAQQGRYTFATAEEAETAMAQLLDVGKNQNDIPGVYGAQAVGTFAVHPVECWPGHHDPKGRYFE